MAKKVLKVTAAIIRDGDKLLLCQRPKEKSCGLLWEFPGGKIEPNETPEQCIARECMEELNIKLENVKYFCKTDYEYPDKVIELLFFNATIENKESMEVKEHNRVAWVTPSELTDYNLCPSDAKMVEEFGSKIKV